MGKGIAELSGLKELRTMHSTRKRSIPRAQSSVYLDLFLLGKEKDRLDKEMFVLDKRKVGLHKRPDEIAAAMKKLEAPSARPKRPAPDETGKRPTKGWKTQAVTY